MEAVAFSNAAGLLMLATASMDGRVQVCEEAPVRDVRAVSAEEGASHKRPRDGPKNLFEIFGRTSLLSKSTLSLPRLRGRLFVTPKRNCASPDVDCDTELYELQDGNIIIVGAKRFRCAEASVPASLTDHPIPRHFLLEQDEVSRLLPKRCTPLSCCQAARPVPKGLLCA